MGACERRDSRTGDDANCASELRPRRLGARLASRLRQLGVRRPESAAGGRRSLPDDADIGLAAAARAVGRRDAVLVPRRRSAAAAADRQLAHDVGRRLPRQSIAGRPVAAAGDDDGGRRTFAGRVDPRGVSGPVAGRFADIADRRRSDAAAEAAQAGRDTRCDVCGQSVKTDADDRAGSSRASPSTAGSLRRRTVSRRPSRLDRIACPQRPSRTPSRPG